MPQIAEPFETAGTASREGLLEDLGDARSFESDQALNGGRDREKRVEN